MKRLLKLSREAIAVAFALTVLSSSAPAATVLVSDIFSSLPTGTRTTGGSFRTADDASAIDGALGFQNSFATGLLGVIGDAGDNYLGTPDSGPAFINYNFSIGLGQSVTIEFDYAFAGYDIGNGTTFLGISLAAVSDIFSVSLTRDGGGTTNVLGPIASTNLNASGSSLITLIGALASSTLYAQGHITQTFNGLAAGAYNLRFQLNEDGSSANVPAIPGFVPDTGGGSPIVFPLTNSAAGIDNVNVTAVPVPPAVWLLGSALVGMIGISRRMQP